jgi:hypothetical protein
MKSRRIFWLNIILSSFISMLFIGCGGGSSSSEKEYTVGKGTYIDSAVSGISYICGKEKGITDENGQFTFEVGASCTFFIKDIELRKVKKDALFDKVVIFEDKPKIAQLLQTLDSDGDASNGITLDPKVIDLLEGKLPENNDELEALVEKIRKAAQEDKSIKYTGSVVSEEDVKEHLEVTRRDLDNTPPDITLVGSTPMRVNQNETFIDPSVTVTDNYYDIDEITITTSGTVDTTTPNSYTLTYTATDGASNSSTATRVVTVVDVTAPVLTLVGGKQTIEVGDAYVELGATATDNSDGDITSNIVIDTSNINLSSLGTYVVSYNVSDSEGNSASAITREVEVVDNIAPTIQLNGTNAISQLLNVNYSEQGATCSDNYDGTCSVTISGESVETTHTGDYVITYNAVDASGNHATEVRRTVSVILGVSPVIHINGDNPYLLELGTTYNDAGATATDAEDCTVVVSSNIASVLNQLGTLGEYTVTYTATDSQGNVVTATRAINVIESSVDKIAKNNSLHDVNVTFDSFTVVVYTDTLVETTSNSTKAIYGNIDGNPTDALLQVNSNYPNGTAFIVKVFSDGTLVGASQKLILSDASLEFNNISTNN